MYNDIVTQQVIHMYTLVSPINFDKIIDMLEVVKPVELQSLEALQSLATVDRRPVPGNLPETSPLGGWPQLHTGHLDALYDFYGIIVYHIDYTIT